MTLQNWRATQLKIILVNGCKPIFDMLRKKEVAPCSLNRAATASFKLEQDYFFDTV